MLLAVHKSFSIGVEKDENVTQPARIFAGWPTLARRLLLRGFRLATAPVFLCVPGNRKELHLIGHLHLP